MRDPETLLEVMEIRKDRQAYDAQIDDPAWSTEATLILAEQVKRIADILEETSIKNDDGARTLYLIAGVERIG